ncbi:unnamed protein product [Lupinus luteus]|uniref:Uncharacterized protein n=1 Tax=Lupinus luteus TaxID=3873 RepID=A0AAV1VZT7_LUPLU
MDAYCQLLLDAFSNTNNEALPAQQFDMPVAPEIPQPQSQTQTDTHPQPYTQTKPSQQQPPFGFEGFGAMGDYSFSNLASSEVPLFGTTSSTPLSAFNFPQYYQPIMPSQVQQSNLYDIQNRDDDDDKDDDEQKQLVRGGPRNRQ